MYEMLTELLSGLALFLFGMKFMSHSLQQAAGQKLRGFLDKCTKNKYIAVVFGALFTAVIQSSGATTVMEVSFVNAGIMSLEQSIGLTFGANIGTTITSQLVSLKLTAIAPFIIFIGAAIIMFCEKPILVKIAEIIFGFGALFLGINFMTGALGEVPKFPVLVDMFKALSNPILAILIGLVLTVIVQSSSVTVSVLVLLAGSGLVTPLSCLYFILGANIGSCTPAVMSALNTKAEAKRTAFIHVAFNVIGMIVISLILAFASGPIIEAIQSLGADMKRFVANADTIFKTFQTIILLPCSGLLIKLSTFFIKDKKADTDEADEKKLLYIDSSGTPSTSTAVVEIVQEIERMSDMVRQNLTCSMDALLEGNIKHSDEVYKREEYIDYLSHRITEYMVRANRYELPLGDRERLGGLFHVVIDVERIGDHAVNILEDSTKEQNAQIRFSKEGREELISMYGKVMKAFDLAILMFTTMDKGYAEEINKLEDTIDKMKVDCQEGHVKRMSAGQCSIEAGLIFTDLVIGFERIADHAVNIAFSFYPEKK